MYNRFIVELTRKISSQGKNDTSIVLQSFPAFKNYQIWKFGNEVVFLIKRMWIWILRYITCFSSNFEVFVQFCWNLKESTYTFVKHMEHFFENIINLWFYYNFPRKNNGKTQQIVIFRAISLQTYIFVATMI